MMVLPDMYIGTLMKKSAPLVPKGEMKCTHQGFY